MKNNWKDDFTEKGADLEHERWSRWQKYLHSLCSKHTVNSLNASTRQYEDIETGGLVIHRDRVIHWERQIATPYSELTEKEKEYDRIEVRKYLPMVEHLLEEQKKELSNRKIYQCGYDDAKKELMDYLQSLDRDVRLDDICKKIQDFSTK